MAEHIAKKGWLLAVLLLLGLALGGYYGRGVWSYYSTHITTDNAYVQADIAPITPRVSGTVTEILVEDNWQVQAGQVLVRLDSQDSAVRLAEAKASLTRARERVDQLFAEVEVAKAELGTARAQIETQRAEVAVAQADFRQADLDFRRAKEMHEEEVISGQQFDRAQTVYDTARSRLDTRQRALDQVKREEVTRARQLERAKAILGGQDNTKRYERALVQQAQASVREAELQIEYCTLVAPLEGIVSRKAVEVGQRVQAGQPLMAIVPLHEVYIEANYKETQLTHVRVGQPVEIEADIYPGYHYQGVVDSLSAGTGAVFSLLPPQNATGNWVKVVQRLPVKITLSQPPPPDRPLRVGLSLEVRIDISQRAGAQQPVLRSLRQEAAPRQEARSLATGTEE